MSKESIFKHPSLLKATFEQILQQLQDDGYEVLGCSIDTERVDEYKLFETGSISFKLRHRT